MNVSTVEEMKKTREGFDVCKLQSEEIRRRYNVEVKDRFQALGDTVYKIQMKNKIRF